MCFSSFLQRGFWETRTIVVTRNISNGFFLSGWGSTHPGPYVAKKTQPCFILRGQDTPNRVTTYKRSTQVNNFATFWWIHDLTEAFWKGLNRGLWPTKAFWNCRFKIWEMNWFWTPSCFIPSLQVKVRMAKLCRIVINPKSFVFHPCTITMLNLYNVAPPGESITSAGGFRVC